MLSNASVLFCVVVLMAGQSTGFRRGYYTVVAPGSVRTNTPYHVAVSLGDFHQASWFNISLIDRFRLNVQKTVQVQPRTTQLVSLDVPKLHFGFAKLIVVGFKGIITKHEASVSVENHDYQVYVQTDKPRYKPGELVQFRVICVDELTRPAVTDDVLDVLIYDSDGNLVKRIENIKLTQGVFKGQFQLSEYTLLGKWDIKVESSGSNMKTKSFLVSRYVLPRFAVEIVTKPDVSVHDGEIKILVKAKYAHDEPVKGNLSVSFAVKQPVIGALRRTFSREVDIEGYHVFNVDVERDLHIKKQDFEGKSLKICVLSLDAGLTDDTTKQVVEESAEVTIHSSPYKIKVEAPKEFIPEVPVDIKVSITDMQDRPVKDQRSPVKILVKSPELNVVDFPVITFLNDKGVGEAQLNLTDGGFPMYSLTAEFHGYESPHEALRLRTGNVFSLNVLTPRQDIGKDMIVELKSRNPINHFVYEIVSRGKILKAEHVTVPEGSTKHILRLTTTHAMIPKISLYVHRIHGGKLDSALADIHIGKALENSIEIDVEREVRPGASVSVNISTDAGSYVGLLGIDRRLLLDTEQEDNFNEDRVFSRLKAYDAKNFNNDVNPGSAAGLVTFTNTLKPPGDSGVVVVNRFDDEDDDNVVWGGDRAKPRIRRIFSDGWLFDDFERTPKGGLHLNPTIPDGITSWAISGFSLNPTTGLSFTNSPSPVRVFQSFFVSIDLPNLVREGEILEVPVYVFNYNNAEAFTAVTIESESEHLVILENFTDNAQFSFNQAFSVPIPAQGKMKFTFPVKPLKAGLFNLTVRAMSPVGSDALQKTFSVVSQGVPHLTSKTYLVHFLENSEQEDELLVNIPETAIRGSEKVEMSVVGDTFGPLMQSLWDLVQVPYGDGREMTTHFISNLLVLKYLKTFNVNNQSLERKAMVFLERGYQSLLTLKHSDGSFSFFERATRTTGDALQTSIVMWGLQQAKKFIAVDSNVIKRCLNSYLKPMQAPDGGIQSEGGPEDDVTLTALALLSFMEDESMAHVTSKGLDFLYNSLDDLQSPLSIALSQYVLVRGRHEKSQKILKQLSTYFSRSQTSQQVVWDRLTTLQATLKATSGSFLSILQTQAKPTETLLPLVTTLLSSGDSEKIPTHLLALDAMIGLARDLRIGARNLNVHFEGDQGDAGDVKVNSSTVHVRQTVELNSATRKVRLQSRGKGFAVVSLRSRYNMPRQNQSSPNFQTNVTETGRRESFVSLKVCVSARTATDFTDLKVILPSGYTIQEQSDNPFNSNLGQYDRARWFLRHQTVVSPKLKVLKVDSGAGSMHAIFKDIDQMGACVDLNALRAFRVLNAREVAVTVSDVYNEGQSTIFHEMDWTEETS